MNITEKSPPLSGPISFYTISQVSTTKRSFSSLSRDIALEALANLSSRDRVNFMKTNRQYRQLGHTMMAKEIHYLQNRIENGLKKTLDPINYKQKVKGIDAVFRHPRFLTPGLNFQDRERFLEEQIIMIFKKNISSDIFLNSNKDLMLIFAKTCKSKFNLDSDELKNNEEFMKCIVAQNGLALRFASDELKNNKEVVKLAVTKDGFALEYASNELKNNEEVVKIAKVEELLNLLQMK